MMESVLWYGWEVWCLKTDLKGRPATVGMDYLRRSAKISRLERKTNEEVGAVMGAEETVIERIER